MRVIQDPKRMQTRDGGVDLRGVAHQALGWRSQEILQLVTLERRELQRRAKNNAN
jgi:hypothetical protein